MPKPSTLIIGCLVWLMATAGALSAEDVSDEGKLWTTRWSFEEVNVAKLANRLKSIGLDLGIDLKGIVTADLAVGVPWRSPGDAAAYRFHGKLTSPKLAVESFELQDLVAVVDYRDGVLKMTKLSSSILDNPDDPIGKLVGEAALQLVPREDATAKLTIEDLPLAPFSDLINKLLGSESDLVAQRGRASGEISFRAPLNQIPDVTTYRLDGTLVCEDVKVPGIPALDIEIGQVEIRDARLKVRELDASTRTLRKGNRDIRVLGSVDLPLDGRGKFSAELLGDNVPLSELASLLTASSGRSSFAIIKGKLDFRVSGTGELAANADETTWTVEGSVASPSLQLAGVEVGVLEHRLRFTANRFEMQPLDQESPLPEAVIIERVVTQHQITPDALVLKAFNASVFGGTIAGSGNWPRSKKGDLAVNATLDAIQPEWRLPLVGSLTAPVTASLSGKVNWQVPIQKLQEPSAHQGTALLTATDIRIGQERVGELKTNVAATPESISLESKGRLFDGTIEIASTADLRSTSSWPGVIRQLKSARLKFNEVSVGSLIDLLVGERLRVSGKASGQAVTRSDGRQENLASVPRLKLTAELSDIRHKANLLSKEVELNGLFENRTVTIQKIAGDYAGGSFQSNGRIDLFDPDNSFSPRTDLRVRASRIDADRGLWFIGERSERFSGSLSARGQVTGSGEFFRLRGSCDGRRLAAYGLPLGVAHSSLLGSVSLRSMKWKLALPSIRSNLGVGRVEGQVHLASARRGGVNLTSRWKARRVDVFALARRAGQSTTPTRGEVSGVLTLDGKSLRSVDDLTGRFDVDIEHTSGSAIPGLVAASQLLTTVSLVNQNFEVGEAKGTISNGVMAIEKFWIGSNQAIVRADGKVYLASRRLDLQALIATGDYKDIAGNFAELVQSNAIASVLPASAILSVSELLKDRTLVVGVTGTLQSPIVRLRAVETFREEVARFLLREGQRLILAGSAIGAIDGAADGF